LHEQKTPDASWDGTPASSEAFRGSHSAAPATHQYHTRICQKIKQLPEKSEKTLTLETRDETGRRRKKKEGGVPCLQFAL